MSTDTTTVGWREWIALPELNVPLLKVKIDTGARTSALHAVDIERVSVNGKDMVSFGIQPIQRNSTIVVRAQAPLVDIRAVSDSGGHVEERYVISSRLIMGNMDEDIDITLTERNQMMFRMLIGRTALAGSVIIDPAASYLHGRRTSQELQAAYVEGES